MKIGKRLQRQFKKHILRDVFLHEYDRWVADKGDTSLRLDYDLNERSIVFDIGGYLGDFSEEISRRYNSRIYLFEPSKEFYLKCVDRFSDQDNIRCFNYGISDRDSTVALSSGDDGSSTRKERTTKTLGSESVELRSFESVYSELGVSEIDLMKINIEGGEYDLMPHLITSNLVQMVRNVQVQFHDFVSNAASAKSEICQQMKLTHTQSWCYEFVWENWTIKDNTKDSLAPSLP